MTEKETIRKRHSRSFGIIFGLIAGLALLLGVAFLGWYFVVVQPSSSALNRSASALGKIFGEKTTVSGYSINIENKEIRELAVVERTVQTLTKYETIWAGSKKVVIVRGRFKVKAGFDFENSPTFEILENRLTGQLPPAKVLSIEMQEFEVFHSEHGLINRLQPQDQEQAVNLLIKQARKDAEESGIREQADAFIRMRFKDLTNDAIPWEPTPLP